MSLCHFLDLPQVTLFIAQRCSFVIERSLGSSCCLVGDPSWLSPPKLLLLSSFGSCLLVGPLSSWGLSYHFNGVPRGNIRVDECPW